MPISERGIRALILSSEDRLQVSAGPSREWLKTAVVQIEKEPTFTIEVSSAVAGFEPQQIEVELIGLQREPFTEGKLLLLRVAELGTPNGALMDIYRYSPEMGEGTINLVG